MVLFSGFDVGLSAKHCVFETWGCTGIRWEDLDPMIAVGSSRCLTLTNVQRKISANLKLALAREMESANVFAFAPAFA